MPQGHSFMFQSLQQSDEKMLSGKAWMLSSLGLQMRLCRTYRSELILLYIL